MKARKKIERKEKEEKRRKRRLNKKKKRKNKNKNKKKFILPKLFFCKNKYLNLYSYL